VARKAWAIIQGVSGQKKRTARRSGASGESGCRYTPGGDFCTGGYCLVLD
jgi:hypothetical protein